MMRLDRSAFFAFLAARFSFRLLPCFLFCPEGGALLAIARAYAAGAARDRHAASTGHRSGDGVHTGTTLASDE